MSGGSAQHIGEGKKTVFVFDGKDVVPAKLIGTEKVTANMLHHRTDLTLGEQAQLVLINHRDIGERIYGYSTRQVFESLEEARIAQTQSEKAFTPAYVHPEHHDPRWVKKVPDAIAFTYPAYHEQPRTPRARIAKPRGMRLQ